MALIGFPKPRMEEERRIALFPEQVRQVAHPELLFFETRYGADNHITDDAYRAAGANIVSGEEAYSLDILCQPKFCEEDLPLVKRNQTIFGWVHITDESPMTAELANREMTVIAWEAMFKNCTNIFQRNGMLTGEIGVRHAIAAAGTPPAQYMQYCVALIGRGRVGIGAQEQLRRMGIKDITVYHSENSSLLKQHIAKYDLLVHAACAEYVILDAQDMARMKPGGMLIHLGGDCIESDIEVRSIDDPIGVFNKGRNRYYCINHVPTIEHQRASRYISEDVAPYIDLLASDKMDQTLRGAVLIDHGIPQMQKLSNWFNFRRILSA